MDLNSIDAIGFGVILGPFFGIESIGKIILSSRALSPADLTDQLIKTHLSRYSCIFLNNLSFSESRQIVFNDKWYFRKRANSVKEVLLFVEFLIFGVTDSELIMLNKKTVIIYYCNNMNIHCKWTLPSNYTVPETAQKSKETI